MLVRILAVPPAREAAGADPRIAAGDPPLFSDVT